MNTVLAYGRGLTSPKCLFALLLLAILVVSPVTAEFTKAFPVNSNVVYNKSYSIPVDGSTPFDLWAGSIAIGIILIIISFKADWFLNGEEGLVSILAWIPISFSIYTAFAVDITRGYGVTSQIINRSFYDPALQEYVYTDVDYVLMESHTVYHFDAVALCLFILLAFAIGNTYRIYLSQKQVRILENNSEI